MSPLELKKKRNSQSKQSARLRSLPKSELFSHMEFPETRNKMCVIVTANIREPQMNYNALTLRVLLNLVLSDGAETSEMFGIL